MVDTVTSVPPFPPPPRACACAFPRCSSSLLRRAETPAVYTHVQSYADWIADVVHQGCSRRPAIASEPLTCGAAVTGATSGEPQPDTAYSFEAVAPGTYTFDACGVAPVDSGTANAGVAGGLNLYVYPLHAGGYFGELIRAERGNHSCAVGTDGARVTVLLPPGSYALAIEPATPSTAGVYQLAMSCGGSGDSCADDADVDPAEIGGEACGYWLGRNCVHSTGAYYGLTAAEGAALAQRCPYSCGTCDTPQIRHGDRVYGSTCTGRSSATLQFTVPSALHVIFDGCESELDTIVSVYRGAELVARNDDHCDATRAGCYGTCAERSPAVGSASASFLRVPLLAGSYTVVITGYDAGVLGRYALSMRFDGDADITASPTTSPTHPPPTTAPSPPTHPPTAAPAAACPASHLDSSTRPGQSGQLLNRIVGDIAECIALCSETELCTTARYRESDRRCQVYQEQTNRVNCGSGRVCCVAQVAPPSAAPSAPPTRSPIADFGVCATGCRRGNRPLASLYTAEGRSGADGGGGGGGGGEEVRYRLRSVGNCDGFSFIDTVEQCAAAAARLGLGDATPLSASRAVDPYGCFFKASEPQPGLYFNANGNRNDDDVTRVSLCRELAVPCRDANAVGVLALPLRCLRSGWLAHFNVSIRSFFWGGDGVSLLVDPAKAGTTRSMARTRRCTVLPRYHPLCTLGNPLPRPGRTDGRPCSGGPHRGGCGLRAPAARWPSRASTPRVHLETLTSRSKLVLLQG